MGVLKVNINLKKAIMACFNQRNGSIIELTTLKTYFTKINKEIKSGTYTAYYDKLKEVFNLI
jgi:hypothetical protein